MILIAVLKETSTPSVNTSLRVLLSNQSATMQNLEINSARITMRSCWALVFNADLLRHAPRSPDQFGISLTDISLNLDRNVVSSLQELGSPLRTDAGNRGRRSSANMRQFSTFANVSLALGERNHTAASSRTMFDSEASFIIGKALMTEIEFFG